MVMTANILRVTCHLSLYFVLGRKINIYIVDLHICNIFKGCPILKEELSSLKLEKEKFLLMS